MNEMEDKQLQNGYEVKWQKPGQYRRNQFRRSLGEHRLWREWFVDQMCFKLFEKECCGEIMEVNEDQAWK